MLLLLFKIVLPIVICISLVGLVVAWFVHGRGASVVERLNCQQQRHPRMNIIALDMDETLVHSKEIVTWPEGRREYAVLERPGVGDFLRGVSGAFAEVAVFTASVKEYADPILDGLEARHRVRFGRRFYRESCTWMPQNLAYAKDLRLFGTSMASVLLVDNLPTSYALQPANGVPVASWMGKENDDALARLLPFLVEDVARAPDVRVPIVAARFPAVM